MKCNTVKIDDLHVPKSKGSVQVGTFNTETGELRVLDGGPNIIVYEGVDLLAAILAGQPYDINTMYMEFTNGVVPTVTPDPADGRDYYAALESGLSDRDYIRVTLTANPTRESTDETKFTGNKINYFAMSTGATAGRGGKAFTTGSKVYGVALVAAPDVDDASQDVVFSRSYNFTEKTKQVNEEISIAWGHVFGEELTSSS
jgi:hypothetical protein